MDDEQRRDDDSSPLEPGFQDASRPVAPPPRRSGGLRANPRMAWVVGLVVLAVVVFFVVLALG